MIKSKKTLYITSAIFLLLELTLGVLVQITSGKLNLAVSFGAIALACLFTITLFTKTTEYALTQTAILCAVIADFFLVLLASHRELAMVSFSIAQICYFLRIYLNHDNKKAKIIHLCVRGAVITLALILTCIVLKEQTDFLSLISLFYYANLVMNVIYSYSQFKISKLLAIGLTLFALCDLFVGFSVLNSLYLTMEEGTLLYWLAHPGFNLAWVFYVPSQTLLALSVAKTKLKSIKSDN